MHCAHATFHFFPGLSAQDRAKNRKLDAAGRSSVAGKAESVLVTQVYTKPNFVLQCLQALLCMHSLGAPPEHIVNGWCLGGLVSKIEGRNKA